MPIAAHVKRFSPSAIQVTVATITVPTLHYYSKQPVLRSYFLFLTSRGACVMAPPKTPRVRCRVSGVRCQVSGARFQVAGASLRCELSAVPNIVATNHSLHGPHPLAASLSMHVIDLTALSGSHFSDLTFGVEQSHTAWPPSGDDPIHSGTSSHCMLSSSAGSEQKNHCLDGSGSSSSATMSKSRQGAYIPVRCTRI